MILLSESIIEEAKKEAVNMLQAGEDTRSLILTSNENRDGKGSMMAVSTERGSLIGAFPFEVNGKTFFVGIEKSNRV